MEGRTGLTGWQPQRGCRSHSQEQLVHRMLLQPPLGQHIMADHVTRCCGIQEQRQRPPAPTHMSPGVICEGSQRGLHPVARQKPGRHGSRRLASPRNAWSCATTTLLTTFPRHGKFETRQPLARTTRPRTASSRVGRLPPLLAPPPPKIGTDL